MHFIHACAWDKGNYYAKNQDSFAVQTVLTGSGPYAMVMICDGVGSLSKGEYASGITVREMTDWFYECGLPLLCQKSAADTLLRSCKRALQAVHKRLMKQAQKDGITMGTTFLMLILTRCQYYCFQIGDCSGFKIGGNIKIIGVKQVNKKGELLGVIGVGNMPDIMFQKGRFKRKERFVICSDGFGRCLNSQALKTLGDYKMSEERIRKLIYEILDRGRRKGERDNCTVIVIGKK